MNTSSSTPNDATKKTAWAPKKVVGFGVIVAGLLLVAFGAWFLWPHPATVKVGAATFTVRVATTTAERTQGLSGVPSLRPNEGMLFIFDTDDRWKFWMKDMRIPIDIIWLDSAKTVVHVQAHTTPDSYPTSYAPPTPARYVLEVAAGQAAANHITPGKSAKFYIPAWSGGMIKL